MHMGGTEIPHLVKKMLADFRIQLTALTANEDCINAVIKYIQLFDASTFDDAIINIVGRQLKISTEFSRSETAH